MGTGRLTYLLGIGITLSGSAVLAQSADSTPVLSGGSLKEVRVSTPYQKWQKDSAENRVIHRKRLGDAVLKPKVYFLGPMIVVDKPLTWLALKFSGKQKRYLKFKKELEAHETETLFALRYNAPLVRRLTGLDDSAAYVFIRENPMPRDFYDTATELELMQWVRDRYRGWKK